MGIIEASACIEQFEFGRCRDVLGYNSFSVLKQCDEDGSGECVFLSAVLLKLPVSVVQRADLTSLEPTRDTVEVEGVLSEQSVKRHICMF